jgi:hypothetical protein
LIFVIFTIYKTPNIINSWPKINLQLSSSRLPYYTKILPKKPRQFAIFASSIHSILRSYIFYTPIAAAAWQRIGYEVIVVFVGDFTNNNSNASLSVQLNLSRTFLQRLGVHILNFQCDKSYSVKMSQLVRIFAGYLSDTLVSDDDYILTTDSDIIPINKQDYQLKANTSGFLYNAFCCGSFERRGKSYHMYPLSHICLSKKIWRDLFLESIQRKEIFNSNLSFLNPILLSDKAPFSFETISLYTRQEFGQMYDSNMSKGDSAWYMDQVYSSMLITDYSKKHPNIIINKRSKTSRRLDPHLPDFMWEPERLQKFGDAHIIHDEIFYSYRWKPFKNLLFLLFNSSLANDFDFYYKQYTLDLLQNSKDY